MKLIYLDIDGVMNSTITSEGEHISDMSVDKLSELQKLIDISKADGIILISDRRESKIDLANKTKVFEEYDIPVLDSIRNPRIDINDTRGLQILDHYNESKDNIESFVILDDNDDGISELFPNNFIKINRFYGLDDKTTEIAVSLLNKR